MNLQPILALVHQWDADYRGLMDTHESNALGPEHTARLFGARTRLDECQRQLKVALSEAVKLPATEPATIDFNDDPGNYCRQADAAARARVSTDFDRAMATIEAIRTGARDESLAACANVMEDPSTREEQIAWLARYAADSEYEVDYHVPALSHMSNRQLQELIDRWLDVATEDAQRGEIVLDAHLAD